MSHRADSRRSSAQHAGAGRGRTSTASSALRFASAAPGEGLGGVCAGSSVRSTAATSGGFAAGDFAAGSGLGDAAGGFFAEAPPKKERISPGIARGVEAGAFRANAGVAGAVIWSEGDCKLCARVQKRRACQKMLDER